MTFGNVVKVPFPYTNRPVQQRRPALVVATHETADAPLLLWVLMITSALHRRWPTDHEISALGQTGLPAPSLVRCAKIATIEAADAELIGCLDGSDKQAVGSRLMRFLADAVRSY